MARQTGTLALSICCFLVASCGDDASRPGDDLADATADTALPDVADTALPDVAVVADTADSETDAVAPDTTPPDDGDIAAPETLDTTNPGCPEGRHLCDGTCVASDSVESCGDRCSPCAVPENGEATCDGTVCGFRCDEAFEACDGACVPANLTYCGGSCTPCRDLPNGQWACSVMDVCLATCDAGFIGDTCGKPTLTETWTGGSTLRKVLASRVLADGSIVVVSLAGGGYAIHTRPAGAALFSDAVIVALSPYSNQAAISTAGDIAASSASGTSLTLRNRNGTTETLAVPRLNGVAMSAVGAMLFADDGALHLFPFYGNSNWFHVVRSANGTWSTPVELSDRSPILDVTHAPDGTLYLLESANGPLRLKALAPDGTITTSTVPGAELTPIGTLAVDQAGVVHILSSNWASDDTNTQHVRYVTWSAGQWSSSIIVDSGQGVYPWQMLIGRGGLPLAVTAGYRNSPESSYARFLQLSSDGWHVTPIYVGESFSLTDNETFHADFVLDSSGAPVIFTQQANQPWLMRVFDAKQSD